MKINIQTTLEMYLQIKTCKCLYLFNKQHFHYINNQVCNKSYHTKTFRGDINQRFPNRVKRLFKNETYKN